MKLPQSQSFPWCKRNPTENSQTLEANKKGVAMVLELECVCVGDQVKNRKYACSFLVFRLDI